MHLKYACYSAHHLSGLLIGLLLIAVPFMQRLTALNTSRIISPRKSHLSEMSPMHFFKRKGKLKSTTDSDAQLASLSRQMEVLNADLEDILQSLKLLRVELTDARKMSLAEQAFRTMQIVLLVPALILMALSFQSPIGAADNSRKEMISHHELQSGHYHKIACSIFFPLFVFLLGAYWYFNNQSDDLTPEIRRMMVEIEYEEELGDINPTELKPEDRTATSTGPAILPL